jgi:hypothetical protein
MIVGSARVTSTADMMTCIKEVAKELMSADPLELGIGNIIRRVLYIIREAYQNEMKAQAADGLPRLPSSLRLERGMTMDAVALSSSITGGTADSEGEWNAPFSTNIKRASIQDIEELVEETDLEHITQTIRCASILL